MIQVSQNESGAVLKRIRSRLFQWNTTDVRFNNIGYVENNGSTNIFAERCRRYRKMFCIPGGGTFHSYAELGKTGLVCGRGRRSEGAGYVGRADAGRIIVDRDSLIGRIEFYIRRGLVRMGRIKR